MKTGAPRYEQETPDVLHAFALAQAAIDSHGLDQTVRNLVMLRASQINRCAYCVKMHSEDARATGETDERLDHLVVWEQADDFTASERAALAWVEALTRLDPHADLGSLCTVLREHYSEEQVATLSALVAMTNLWNRIDMSRH